MKFFPLLLLAVIGSGVTTQPLNCFPRMANQPNIQPYEQEMPVMPADTAPFYGQQQNVGDPAQAAAVQNPIKGSPQAVDLGRVYYGYYCAMCHGEFGDGEGLVGRSYTPRPTDLTSAQVQGMSDGEMAVKMVIGTGHSPVLESTVELERRWYIVHYVRSLAAGDSGE